MSARDDYPDLGTLRDAYIDGTPQFGGFEAGRALAEIDWLRQDALDEIDRLRAERDTLTAENAELQNEYDEVWDGREALRVALVAWKRARAKSRRDWSEPQAMAALLDMVPADYWGLAPREEGKQ